jgi:hypothetical protein
MWISKNSDTTVYELDEVYWFLERKSRDDTRANIYIMTMICPNPRQILGFRVDYSVNAKAIQSIVDNAPYAK